MGYTRKRLCFEIERYPSIICSICNLPKLHTLLYILLNCHYQYIHALRIKPYNKIVWELSKLLISSNKSKSFILMNVETFNDNLPKLKYNVLEEI